MKGLMTLLLYSHYHRLLSWLKCCRRGVQLCGLSLGLTVMFARDATPLTPPWSTPRPPSRPPPPPRTQQCPDRPPDSASEIVANSPWPGLPPPTPEKYKTVRHYSKLCPQKTFKVCSSTKNVHGFSFISVFTGTPSRYINVAFNRRWFSAPIYEDFILTRSRRWKKKFCQRFFVDKMDFVLWLFVNITLQPEAPSYFCDLP